MVNLLSCSLNILNSYVPKAIIPFSQSSPDNWATVEVNGHITVWTQAPVWMSLPMGVGANLDAKCNYDTSSSFWTHQPTCFHSDCWLVLSLTWVVGLWEGDELHLHWKYVLRENLLPSPLRSNTDSRQQWRIPEVPPPHTHTHSSSSSRQSLRSAFYSWLSTCAVIYICQLLIIAGAAVFSIRRWIRRLMICINTCRCFVSHWYLMNFKHWFFTSGNSSSHKTSSSNNGTHVRFRCDFCKHVTFVPEPLISQPIADKYIL